MGLNDIRKPEECALLFAQDRAMLVKLAQKLDEGTMSGKECERYARWLRSLADQVIRRAAPSGACGELVLGVIPDNAPMAYVTR